MAVVQISRIQVRRGKKNTATSLPQLASGELGWAIDTQELFIGNGAVSEGAPYVGNTKLLSEHDDLFELANNYIYREGSFIQTGDNANAPVLRTLQSRLDDRVSVRSFGANGDGSDQTVELQRAIDQLFLNSNKNNPQARQVLYLEAGTYVISNTIYLPPYTTLVGAGVGKTVINMTGDSPAFKTINSAATPGNYATDAATTTNNQATSILMSSMQISTVSAEPALKLTFCKDSKFTDLKISGSFSNGDSEWMDTDVGIYLEIPNSIGTAETANNFFENIQIEKYGYAIRSEYDIFNNYWHRCKINNCGYGVEFGENSDLVTSGQETGPLNNTISYTEFNDIDRHGFWVSNGKNNHSSNNRYIDVGNDTGTELNATYSVVKIGDHSNKSTSDYFSRTSSLSYGQEFINSTPYIPEIEGKTIASQDYTNKTQLINYGEYEKLFRLPGNSTKGYEIPYLYASNAVDAMRQGVLTINNNTNSGTVSLSDEFDYTGNSAFEENLVFRADIQTINGVDNIVISVLNSTGGDSDAADFYWTVKTKTH